MKEIREWIREMDREERREFISGIVAWSSILWLGFIITIVAG